MSLEVGRAKRGRRSKRRRGRRGKDFEEQDDSGQRGHDHWSNERGGMWWPDGCKGPSSTMPHHGSKVMLRRLLLLT